MAEETGTLKINLDVDNALQQMNKLEQSLEKISKTKFDDVKTLEDQLNRAKDVAVEIGRTFGTNSQEFKEAIGVVDQLSSEFKNLEAAVDRVVDRNQAIAESKAFSKLSQGVGLALNGMVALQGGMQAFGVESEEATQAIAKLQGLMAFKDSLKELQAMAKGMNLFGASTSQAATAGKAMGASTKIMNGALKTTKVALASLGIGLIITALAFLIENFDKVKDTLSNIFPALKELPKLFDQAKDIVMAAGKTIIDMVINIGENIANLFSGKWDQISFKNPITQFNKELKVQNELSEQERQTQSNINKLGEERNRIISKGKDTNQIDLKIEREKLKLTKEGSDARKEGLEKIAGLEGNIAKAAAEERKRAADAAKAASDKRREENKRRLEEINNIKKELNDMMTIFDKSFNDTLKNKFQDVIPNILGMNADNKPLEEIRKSLSDVYKEAEELTKKMDFVKLSNSKQSLGNTALGVLIKYVLGDQESIGVFARMMENAKKGLNPLEVFVAELDKLSYKLYDIKKELEKSTPDPFVINKVIEAYTPDPEKVDAIRLAIGKISGLKVEYEILFRDGLITDEMYKNITSKFNNLMVGVLNGTQDLDAAYKYYDDAFKQFMFMGKKIQTPSDKNTLEKTIKQFLEFRKGFTPEKATEPLTRFAEDIAKISNQVLDSIPLSMEEIQTDGVKARIDNYYKEMSKYADTLVLQLQGIYAKFNKIKIDENRNAVGNSNTFANLFGGIPSFAKEGKLIEDEMTKMLEIENVNYNLKRDQMIANNESTEALENEHQNKVTEIQANAIQKRRELNKKGLDAALAIANAMGGLLGSLADGQEQGTKKWKNIKIAEATINMISGAVAAFTQAQSSYPTPAGLIIGGLSAAAVVASGVKSINDIKKTKVGKGDSGGSASIPSLDFSAPMISNAMNVQDVRMINDENNLMEVQITDRELQRNNDRRGLNNNLRGL